ncbi:MFS transporter [Kibdelosporangium phytohabitans]|uniref:MFS transporter n=1 Tax=Kibdelosporangium phytohabitans TaxID=860235 RepID=UPI0007C856C4|nr:MFS transporter [Kibdelosporangium phytohabitans]MBE1467439.1 EmrB/QacA subfamily drug resistance transporter [Kibdelosporangium phytohabitans]
MTGKQKAVLAVLLGAQFMFALDFSILTVALPRLQNELGFGLDTVQWVITAFALTAAGFMLMFGRIGDLIGRKVLFLTGMALLTASSLVGGFATTPLVLVIARVAQGLATAIVVPSGMALLTTSFPEGPLRTRALGLNGALLSLGFGSGAVLGGVLTDVWSWRWTFLINVPVGAVLLVAAAVLIVESRAVERLPLDVPGTATVTVGLLALVWGLTGAERHGWTSPDTVISLTAAIILLIAFYAIELRASAPLAPVRVLRSNAVRWGNLGGLITFSMESAVAFLLTLYMQQVLALTPMQAGLMFGCLGIGAFLGGTITSTIIERIGAKRTLVCGLLVQAANTVVLVWLTETVLVGVVMVLVTSFIGGLGHVLAIVSYTVVATSGIPDHEQGLATGLATMTQQVAFTVGIPVMSTIAATQYGPLQDGVATRDGVLAGTTLGFLIDGLIILVGALAISAFLRAPQPTITAASNADNLAPLRPRTDPSTPREPMKEN